MTNKITNMQSDASKFNTLRTSANEVVNKLFYGEMMRSFRSSQDNPFFGKGPGDSIFVEQLDNKMISAMSKTGRNGVADALLKQLDPKGYNAYFFHGTRDHQGNAYKGLVAND